MSESKNLNDSKIEEKNRDDVRFHNKLLENLNTNIGTIVVGIVIGLFIKVYDSVDARWKLQEIQRQTIRNIETEILLRLWTYADGINSLHEKREKQNLDPSQVQQELNDLMISVESPKNVGLPEYSGLGVAALFTKLDSFYDPTNNESEKHKHNKLRADMHGWRVVKRMFLDMPVLTECELCCDVIVCLDLEKDMLGKSAPFTNWLIEKPIDPEQAISFWYLTCLVSLSTLGGLLIGMYVMKRVS